MRRPRVKGVVGVGAGIVVGVVRPVDTSAEETHMPPRTSLAVPAGQPDVLQSTLAVVGGVTGGGGGGSTSSGGSGSGTTLGG